jgi:hypothetical protein
MIAERQKINSYTGSMARPFFWRTYDRQEIDYVETNGDDVAAYEIKWKEEKAKLPVAFKNAYPGASFKIINRETIWTGLLSNKWVKGRRVASQQIKRKRWADGGIKRMKRGKMEMNEKQERVLKRRIGGWKDSTKKELVKKASSLTIDNLIKN